MIVFVNIAMLDTLSNTGKKSYLSNKLFHGFS